MRREHPAVLSWRRSTVRCVLTGALGAAGVVAALVGWVLTLVEIAAGLPLLGAGLAVVVVSEVLARRFDRTFLTPAQLVQLSYGDASGLDKLVPASPPYPQVLQNLGRRWWQGILGVLAILLALAMTVLALAGSDSGTARLGWACGAVGLFVAAAVSIRIAAASVRIEPGMIHHRCPGSWGAVPAGEVIAVYTRPRPMVVGVVGLRVVVLVMSLFDGSGDDGGDGNLYEPVLLLRDGSAIPLRALATRSEERAARWAALLAGRPPA